MGNGVALPHKHQQAKAELIVFSAETVDVPKHKKFR